ncbi:MAG TPA: ribose-phosphate diphosphokinase, partial [Methylomirabilota bacterium]|nr:ribose-phosphate diphosphokinase [Methylomirabilota bacterium]
RVTVETPCAGRRCALLGATAPPDGDLLGTLLLAHTLRKEGAREVLVLVPYLGYARQDRPEPGRSAGAAWVGALLAATGADRAVAVDVHSPAVPALFPIPLVSLSPAPVFAAAVTALGLPRPTVVAPDEGARERAEAVRRAAGIERPLVSFVKMRAEAGVRHLPLSGQVGPRAVIVDDILDTGGTLVSACERLREAGVSEMVVMVTHGLFTGAGWHRLWDLGVSRIYCSDTTPGPAAVDGRVTVLPVAGVLAAHLAGAPAATAP